MNTKSVLIAAGAATVLLGSLTFAAVNSANRPDFSAVKTAVEANNYASLPDTAKAKITEAQFATMVTKATEHKAVEAAVVAGDYTAFKNAKIAEIPTETEFQKMVSARKAHAEAQAKIETAVKNNDFAGYKAAITAEKAQMDANRPDANGTHPAPTDAQLQKRFDQLVKYYKTNGKLPEMGKSGFAGRGMMGAGKMMGGKMGGHGPRGEGKKGE